MSNILRDYNLPTIEDLINIQPMRKLINNEFLFSLLDDNDQLIDFRKELDKILDIDNI